ncbi:MAG: class I SAM-dependent methyltransferase, partial [Armatimonadota bacterium]
MSSGAGDSQRLRLPLVRRLLKRFHPEAIPGRAAAIYNAVSSSRMFRFHYDLAAEDIVSYCAKGRLLDIGTGPGRLLLKLHQLAPDMSLVGLDASPGMVAQAQRNAAEAGLGDAVAVTAGYANRLPFAEGAFDIVVSTGSLHHWKDPIGGLNEAHRVLKDEGHALMYDIASDTPKDVLREMRRRFGWLWPTLFWLHGFQEPFYKREDFEALAGDSAFAEGSTKLVGLLCCLV